MKIYNQIIISIGETLSSSYPGRYSPSALHVAKVIAHLESYKSNFLNAAHNFPSLNDRRYCGIEVTVSLLGKRSRCRCLLPDFLFGRNENPFWGGHPFVPGNRSFQKSIQNFWFLDERLYKSYSCNHARFNERVSEIAFPDAAVGAGVKRHAPVFSFGGAGFF